MSGMRAGATADAKPLISSTSRVRDTAFEQATLETVATAAPVPVIGSPFVADAVARLGMGERAYGDRWTRQPVCALLNELREEASDLAAWGVLVMQSIGGLDADQRTTVEESVLAAMRSAAVAHSAIVRALGVVPPAGRDPRSGSSTERNGDLSRPVRSEGQR